LRKSKKKKKRFSVQQSGIAKSGLQEKNAKKGKTSLKMNYGNHPVRKPFPITKISMGLQELEGFSFATALDLNMGYFTIILDPNASKICTIIFP
jgi:hypothetical protein